MSKKAGFTLIELLVVILIIVILAVVALPQYQKAVVKSRSAQLYASVNALGKAMQSFARANGEWPETFDVLDLDFPLPSQSGTVCNLSVGGGNTLKKGKDYALVIGKSNLWHDAFAIFTSGPYSCAGFAYIQSDVFDSTELYCVERAQRSGYAKGDYCSKVMGFQFERNYYSFDYFK